MSEKTVIYRSSFPTLGLLGIAFVVLKLTGYIDWSWWLVTLPFWIGLAILLGLLTVGLIFAAVAFITALIFSRR